MWSSPRFRTDPYAWLRSRERHLATVFETMSLYDYRHQGIFASTRMWISKTIYEKAPQFCLAAGAFSIAAALYIGFDYEPTTYYIGPGFLCCGYGAAILTLPKRYRRLAQANKEATNST